MEQLLINKKHSMNYWMQLVFLLLFALLEFGCVTPVPSFYACIKTSEITGHCFNSTTSDEFDIDPFNKYQGKTWNQWEFEAIYLFPESYAAIKNYILLTCEKNNSCSPNIKTIQTKLDKLNKK